jgi:hypothetical protein
MHWKSTLLLVALAAGAGAWYFKGDDWAARVGLRPAPAAAESPSLAVLADKLTPAAVTRVEVPQPAGDPLVVEKAGAGWRLPGNWPLRGPEADELVGLLTGLRTRFQPVPLADGADLAAYGLAPDQKPIPVRVTANGIDYLLTFGEPPPTPGEPPFTRPAYVRVNDFPEVVRLGPDVLPLLRRPADGYRRRQLFPDGERVKVAASADPFAPPVGPASGASTVVLLGDRVREVSARGPGKAVTLFGVKVSRPEAYTLRRTGPLPQPVAAEKGGEPAIPPDRLAEAWEIAAPSRDRVDPEKLQKVLTAVPDLWVEEFVSNPDKPTGLDNPERTLSVTRADGQTATLQIGAVARTTTRDESFTPPPTPGLPPFPSTRKVTEEYRYAKLADNPQLFLVKADRFADLFVSARDLRDPRVARFSPDEVDELVITPPGGQPVKLTRVKGDPKADDFAARADRWLLDRPGGPAPAESSLVNGLLDQLSNLRSSATDPKEAAVPEPATTVTLTVREKRADDQPPAQPRTLTLKLGRPEPDRAAVAAAGASGPLAALAALAAGQDGLVAQLAGWPRVSRVEDATLAKDLDRPAVAYRRKRLLDGTGRVESLTLDGPGGTFTLSRTDPSGWKLSGPVALQPDNAEADKLAAPLGGLTAAEWVDDAATPDLPKYGLDQPRKTLTFTVGGKSYTLALGGPRDGKPEVYARLDGGPVFALAAATADPLLNSSALDVLDKTLATVPTIDKLTVTRGGRTTTFARGPNEWAVSAPKPAPADESLAELVRLLGGLRAEKLAALKPTADELKQYGLAEPAATWTAAAGGKEVLTLAVGKDPAGRAYARVGELVGLLPPEASALLLGEFRRRAVWELDEAKVEGIAVRRWAGGFDLARDGGGWKDPAAPDEVIDPKAASELLTTLGTLKAERWADDPKAAGLGVPAGTITLTLRGGEKRVLTLGGVVPGTGGKQRFARAGDGDPFVLSAADTAVLMRGRPDYMRKR